MSYTTLQEKTVTTRKPHRCLGCNTEFPAGTRMRYWFAVEDGTGQGDSSYLCMCCQDYVEQHPSVWNDLDEGVNYGFVVEDRKMLPYSANGS